jgi:hypothetical protein
MKTGRLIVFDLLFPVLGETLPTDHAYPLYAALARVVPAFHDAEGGLRFATLRGVLEAPGRFRLSDRSRLRIRVPEDRVRLVLPLAGRRLDVAGHPLRVGVPSVTTLTPAATLAARVVTFKHSPPGTGRRTRPKQPAESARAEAAKHTGDPARFLATARAKLAELGVEGEPTVPLVMTGPRAGQLQRRVIRVKGNALVGYALKVSGLSAEHSIKLQELGLGGRTRIGCGFFLPVKEDA